MTWDRKVLLGAVVVLVALAAGFGVALQRAEAREARAAQAAEAAKLDLAGVVRAREASERDLRAEADAAKAQVAGFAAALDRAQRAAKGRTVAVARGSTGALPVAPSAAPAGSQDPAACVLRLTDKTSIDVASAEIRTEAGNRVLVLAAQANRIDPDGPHLLFGDAIRTDLTRYLSAEVAPPAPGPGLGIGALALCTATGCSYGALVAPPPWLHGRLELAGGAFGGRGGSGALALALGRF